MTTKRLPQRAIRITEYGHWYAARQRLIKHLDGKCVIKGRNYRIVREPRITGPDTNGHYGFGCVVEHAKVNDGK